jgi:hypothetical protein
MPLWRSVETFISLRRIVRLLIYMQLYFYEIIDMFARFQTNLIYLHRIFWNFQILNFKQFGEMNRFVAVRKPDKARQKLQIRNLANSSKMLIKFFFIFFSRTLHENLLMIFIPLCF